MMLVYGIQPSELQSLDDSEKLALLHHAERLRAKESLRLISIIGLAMSGVSEENRQRFIELANVAFEDDEPTRAKTIEAICRMK